MSDQRLAKWWTERHGARWRVRCRDETGKKFTVATFDDEFDAKRCARDHVVPAADPTSPATASDSGVPPSGASTTSDNRDAAETLAKFIARDGFPTLHLRASSKAAGESHLGAHILPRWGETNLTDIAHLDVQHWVAELATGETSRKSADGSPKLRSAKTVKEIVGTLQRVLAAAVLVGALPINPVKGIKLPQVQRSERGFLSVSEVRALSAAMTTLADQYRDEAKSSNSGSEAIRLARKSEQFARFAPLPLLLGFGGLRIGEAFALRWGRVDTFKSRLEVCENVTEVNGRLEFGEPKTRQGFRTVPMSREVAYSLTDHKRATGAAAVSDAFVFVGYEGKAVRYRNFIDNVWAPAVTMAGLVGVTPHMLRHTAVSLWIAAGYTPKEVSVWAGHASVSFTFDRYGKLFNNDGDNMAKLDAFLDGEPEAA